MAWVYILRGSSGRHYIGSTNDLERRLTEHRNGGTHSTARLGYPLELVASLELSELAEARKLEREWKRKKNPNLAIHLLELRRDASSLSSPERFRGWSGVRVPANPPLLFSINTPRQI